MNWHRVFILLIMLLPVSALAVNFDRSAKMWEAKCKFQDTRFSITSKSVRGLENDPEQLLFVSLSSKPLNIGKALHARSTVVADVISLCDNLPVFDAGNNNILIMLRQDDKPTFDLLTLVLYNLKSKRAVSRIENIGRVKAGPSESITVRKTPEGFDIKLIKQWFKNTTNDTSETPIEGWLRVSVGEKRIEKEWLDPDN